VTSQTVTVRATRRGYYRDRTIDPGEVFACPVEDLALTEDHGANGWMELLDPNELLPMLPAAEAALWRRRRAAAAAAVTAHAAATLAATRLDHATHQLIDVLSTDRHQNAMRQAMAQIAITQARAERASAEETRAQAQAEHAAASETLRRLHAIPRFTELKPQTMETPRRSA
jgi:hypothetical protein